MDGSIVLKSGRASKLGFKAKALIFKVRSQNNLHKVDDWLSHVAEGQCLCVAERFDGRKTALAGFIRLPGTQQPVQREEGRVQIR